MRTTRSILAPIEETIDQMRGLAGEAAREVRHVVDLGRRAKQVIRNLGQAHQRGVAARKAAQRRG